MKGEVVQFLLLLLSAGYAVIGVRVHGFNRESKVNRLFLATCLSLSVWALGYAFMFNGTSRVHANVWRIVASLGWSTFYAHWICFVLLLTENMEKLKSRLLLLVYLPAVLFFLQSATLDPSHVLTKTEIGWLDTNYSSWPEYIFTAYYFSIMFYSLFLLKRWHGMTQFERERKQAHLIFWSVLIPLLIGSMTDSLLPMMGIVIFPMGIIFAAFSMLAIGYAILKYKLMNVTSFYISEGILKNVRIPILVLNSNNKLLYHNEAAELLFESNGHQSFVLEDIVGRIVNEQGALHGLEHQNSCSGDEVTVMTFKEKKIRVMMNLTVLRDEYGDVLGKAAILNDLSNIKEAESIVGDYNKHLMNAADKRTQALMLLNEKLRNEAEERKRVEEQISKMLYYDELTHLPNRLHFKNQVTRLLREYAAEKKRGLAVLFMDLDDFKYVNDSLGHYAGDELLKKVSVRLQELVWGHFLLSRNSGDEFLVLVHDLDPDKGLKVVEELTEAILAGFERCFHVAGKDLYLTVSIGTAFFPKDGLDFDTLVRHADMALFEAKLSGKNKAILSSEEIIARVNRMASIRNSLYKALENNEFQLHYQPQVHTKSRQIIGLEALLRWKMPDGTSISPSEFIPLAEETGLIVPIGEWVIEQAGKKIRDLHKAGHTNLTMAVNVSANQIKQKDFVERTRQILERQGIESGLMEFEITERVGLETLMEAEKTIDRIHQLGIRVSIDDFGTDYSSFMTVKRLPFDKIKIAMEFVQSAHLDFKDAAIVKTITQMGSVLNMKVIAEGVETLEQLNFLENIDCDEIQGYYFYKPLTSEQLDTVLAKGKIVGKE